MSAPPRTILSFGRRIFVALAILVSVSLTLAPIAQAQVTTGALTGSVTTKEDGSALPGVTVEAVHVPTGTRYSAITGSNGRYTIPNVRVGGPYTVTANLEGFQQATVNRIEVGIGTPTDVPVVMGLAGLTEAITVTAVADEIINPNRTGSSSSVAEEQIEILPTVNRSLQDFARTNPYFSVDPMDFSATRITVAGRNNRYNSIQIDGAVNNDLFGLADTGTPGGQTDTQPISLDAIQQLQLVVSPYDVRQGGFTGGGMNAVTRSGSNNWSGSVFGSRRDPDFVGDGPLDRPIADFSQDQYGARLGGPIIKDTLFFFLNGEINRRESPTGFSADGSSGVTVRPEVAAGAVRLRDYLMEHYGYDPGSLGDFPAQTNSDMYFGRLDWNLNSSNQLTLRHNFIDAERDVWGGRSSSRWTFETATYSIADETNSTVAQLNSVISANAFNEGRVSLQTIRDVRAIPVIFPSIEIGGFSRNGTWTAGTERYSGANSLDQDILAVTDDFTLIKGNHTVTLGTHNEFFDFKNLFLSEAYGYYFFKTLDDFEAGKPSEYRVSYATGDNPRRPTEFSASQYGLYANDMWRYSDAVSFTFGLRADMPKFGDTPSFNQQVQDLIGYSTGETASEDVIFSPRVGFNWQPGASGRQQVRGGVGVFAGRTPYVWISNAYANTGVESVALSCFSSSCMPEFNPDALNQPRLGKGGSLSVDLIDPDFEFPRVLRATLGYDTQLPFGVRGTAEMLWSQTQKDVFYYNVNRVASGEVNALDGRPKFTKVSTSLADAILLSNTDKGEETTYTLQFSRPFANGLSLSANYAYQDTKSAFDATSSRAISNWQFRHTKGDIFSQDLSRSAFEVENRFNIAATYNFTTGPLAHNVGLFYNAQSGRPYSVMMGALSGLDMNGDGYTTNDLLYVPAAGQVIFEFRDGSRDGAEEAFNNYVRGLGLKPGEGRILDRYEFNEPWARFLDFHYGLEVPIANFRPELTFDIVNLLNLFDSDKGVIQFVSYQNTTPVVYRGIDKPTGKHVYRENYSGAFSDGSQFSIADARSRWQARVGLRLSF
ncbi:MAG: TonB-dependent receptor [Thermoanaerobaculia bacterium]